MLTDSHCHLTKEFFSNVDEIIKNAENNDVKRIITDADNISSCFEMVELGNAYDNVYFTLGIHPEWASESYEELKSIIMDNLNNPKFIAIGEIGLDYHYGKENRELQLDLFNKQLRLAEMIGKPVIVHSRDATMDTIETLKKYNVKGVIHCFSGSVETAKEYIKMGYYIGVGGVLTFKNSKIKDVIKELPLDKIILETDAPFLSPEPYRGQPNEPKNIKIIAEYLADYLHIDYQELKRITEKNINNIFAIK